MQISAYGNVRYLAGGPRILLLPAVKFGPYTNLCLDRTTCYTGADQGEVPTRYGTKALVPSYNEAPVVYAQSDRRWSQMLYSRKRAYPTPRMRSTTQRDPLELADGGNTKSPKTPHFLPTRERYERRWGCPSAFRLHRRQLPCDVHGHVALCFWPVNRDRVDQHAQNLLLLGQLQRLPRIQPVEPRLGLLQIILRGRNLLHLRLASRTSRTSWSRSCRTSSVSSLYISAVSLPSL